MRLRQSRATAPQALLRRSARRTAARRPNTRSEQSAWNIRTAPRPPLPMEPAKIPCEDLFHPTTAESIRPDADASLRRLKATALRAISFGGSARRGRWGRLRRSAAPPDSSHARGQAVRRAGAPPPTVRTRDMPPRSTAPLARPEGTAHTHASHPPDVSIRRGPPSSSSPCAPGCRSHQGTASGRLPAYGRRLCSSFSLGPKSFLGLTINNSENGAQISRIQNT